LIKCQNFIHEQLLLKRNFLRETIHFIHDFHHAEKILIQRYGSLKAIDTLLLENNHALLINNKNLEKIKELRISWLLYKTTTIKWTRFFSWLPFIKQLLIERIQLFTLQHDFFSHVITTIHEVEEMLTKKMNTFLLQHNQLKEEQMMLNSSKASYLKILAEKISLEKKLGFALNTDHPLDFFAPNNVLCQLDQTLRYDLFVLAMHYWEIQWLFESEHISSLSYTRKDRKKYWNIQAMLTPCFVTTLHSGPGFFQYKTDSQKFETLYDLIDLLIIDEAGQVMPAIAGAMISIAKRLLLVGDTNQIEPIFLLTESIDFANTKKFGLCKNELDYESLKDKGILCSGDASIGHAYGNLIIAGQRKSKFHLKEEIYPGLLLKEHRRCAKEIISYCNELCYNNQLIPMTLEKYSCYPRIGYFHIKGHEEKIGSTRSNSKEALTIVHWIKKNQQKILEMCHEEFKQNEQICLNDCIGIVTPFVAQGRKIRLALNNYGLKIDKVGTVHSLQGAERPIIIFSPVYTACKTHGTFFFDKSVNMLNVAVSRAKRSFLVFGDKDIFDISEPTKPSGLLAKYLFSSKKNEIFDEE
jgi:AAA domain